jgi:hypothetical protein
MRWKTCDEIKDKTIVKDFETNSRYFYAPSGILLWKRDSKHVYVKHGHGEIEALPITTQFLMDN